MRALHFDCFSGISGDMTLAALIDSGVDVAAIRAGLGSLGLPIRLDVEKVRKGGFAATAVRIEAPEEHEHRHLPDIEGILCRLPARQYGVARSIFARLAASEAEVHGIPVEKVHFHEVGALDSIADIAGVAIALDLLKAERITSRSVPVGSGTVKCAHGLMPVPAPATAHLLRGIPLAETTIRGELTTPTGAAILATVVDRWVEQPAMTIEHIGVGAGTRDLLEQPNVLRVLVGTAGGHGWANPAERDQVWMLETNLDDVPAEVIGYCFEELFAAGALDVFSTPIQMKKNRPGVLLSVIAPEEAIGPLEAILFRETGTLGIRRYTVKRDKMQREAVTVETPWGPVKGKRGWREGEMSVFSPEYEDCARVARQYGVPLRQIFAEVERCYNKVKG